MNVVLRIIWLIIFPICILAQVPSWYENNTLKNYPKQIYFTSVAGDTTLGQAILKAQSRIAAQIKISVESKIESEVKENSTQDDITLSESFKENSVSNIEATLAGVEIVKQEKVESMYYVFAALKKDRYLSLLKSEFDLSLNIINELITAGEIYFDRGKLLSSLNNYYLALEKSNKFWIKKSLYESLSNFPSLSIINKERIASLESTIQQILSSIKIELISGDNQEATVGFNLPAPIVFNVSSKSNSGNITIKELPIIIKYENGLVINKTATDENGNIKLYIQAYPTEGARGKIIAAINLVGLREEISEQIKGIQATANYKTLPLTISLQLLNQKGEKEEEFEKRLENFLTGMGYTISKDAALLLEGEIIVISTKELESFSGIQYLASVKLNFDLINKSTNEKISSGSVKGKGISRKNVNYAINSASEKIKFKKKEFAKIFREAFGKIQELKIRN